MYPLGDQVRYKSRQKKKKKKDKDKIDYEIWRI